MSYKQHTITQIILILSFLTVVTNLSTHQSLPTSHTQSSSQQQYLEQLISTEKSLQSKIQQLKQLSLQINDHVKRYKQFPSAQTDTLIKGLNKQRQLLFQINKQLNLPLTNLNCQNLTHSQTNSIRTQITNTQNKILKFESIINQQSQQCMITNQVSTQLSHLNSYINSLSLQLNNRCEQHNNPTPQFVYTLNPAATNYTYGQNASYSQKYQEIIKNLVSNGYTQKQCPIQKPYPHGTNYSNCVLCPSNAHYDFSRSMCLSCPPKYVFNIQSHRCFIKQFNSDVDEKDNYYGKLPVYNPSLENCPSDQPYFNNQECISCKLPSYFDFDTLTCKLCAQGMIFSTITKTCGYQPWNTNPYAQKKTCCGRVIVDPALRTCPQYIPFYNGQKCISCPTSTYFNLQNLQCTNCPAGQGFSVIQHKCIDLIYLQQVYISALTPTSQNYIGQPPKLGQDYENVQKCPQSHPFSNGNMCIACSMPSYFNFQNLQCEICQSNAQFSTLQHKCVEKQTNIYNTNLAAIDNFMGNVPQYSSVYATCPSSKPYFDGHSCINCQLPNFINFDANQCQQCAKKSSFNTVNRQCEVTEQLFYTDLDSPNIYYNGDFEELIDQLQQKKLKNPSLEKCKTDHPYYNAIEGLCQACTNSYPLYDIKFNRCISCTGNSNYDPQERLCLTHGNPTATVERMMMNTIGFL